MNALSRMGHGWWAYGRNTYRKRATVVRRSRKGQRHGDRVESDVNRTGRASRAVMGIVQTVVGADGLVTLTLQRPPANAISGELVAALTHALTQALDRSPRAIVLTGTRGIFSAGADVTQLFETPSQDAVRSLLDDFTALLVALEDAPVPVIAAINGLCFGGAYELALACNYRIAVKSAKIGLTETSLGIIPGAGGCVRLPHLVGPAVAADAIVFARRYSAEQAKKLGLIDAVVGTQQQLMAAARGWVQRMGSQGPSLVPTRVVPIKDGSGQPLSPAAASLQVQAVVTALRRSRKGANQIHQLEALAAIEVSVIKGYDAGMARERQGFFRSAAHPAAQGLYHVFRAANRAKNPEGRIVSASSTTKWNVIAILGGGTMGGGIALWALQSQPTAKVIIKDMDTPAALEAARKRMAMNISRAVKGDAKRAAALSARLTITGSYDDLKDASIVIEAVLEIPALKVKVFQEVLGVVSPTCILATNTSTISLTTIAQAAFGDQKDEWKRFIGLHFFSPADIMKLVEIIVPPFTSHQCVDACVSNLRTMRKTCVIVGDCNGFLINRVFLAEQVMASWMVATCGVSPYQVDAALFKFGFPMGVFRMMDLVGADVVVKVARLMLGEYTFRAPFKDARGKPLLCNPLAEVMEGEKLLGEKTKKGFYTHPGNRPNKKVVAAVLSKDGVTKFADPAMANAITSDQDIIDICLCGVVSDCFACLDEGIVSRESDADIASVLAMGFPAYRGGILHWARHERGLLQLIGAMKAWHGRTGLDCFIPHPRMIREAALEQKRAKM